MLGKIVEINRTLRISQSFYGISSNPEQTLDLNQWFRTIAEQQDFFV
ncbi:MAG: hypothetical protein L3J63_01990 [Geopsychrobacter sp.]|nr:hypothetical protein [Geopsychrobacter sp.]